MLVYHCPMHKVTFEIRQRLAELEAKNDKRYGFAEIAAGTGDRLSRQHVRRLLEKTPTRPDVETLGALLDFFEDQGMPITVADLFTVTRTDEV